MEGRFLIKCYNYLLLIARSHSRAFREGEVLKQFQDFREKFWSKFWISLYIPYIFTSPSAQDREKSASLGKLFLPNCPLGWPLDCLCWGLMTRQPLWVILCHLPEKGRKEIVEEIKERDKEERGK